MTAQGRGRRAAADGRSLAPLTHAPAAEPAATPAATPAAEPAAATGAIDFIHATHGSAP
ncbi:hypothetical protein [Streptomyces sp. NPDC002265]|uniref:hypothetical protein n=1 Tax=Streptomyces sp. NPDC002265 TaxID=3154415 RepID=UPI00331CB603